MNNLSSWKWTWKKSDSTGNLTLTLRWAGPTLYTLKSTWKHGIVGTLKQRRRRRQREQEKSHGFRLAKYHAFLHISLPTGRRSTTWKCLISRFVENAYVNTRQRLPFFLNFDTVFYNSTPEKFADIWRIERVGISARKFEVGQIHFWIGIFVSFTVVIA